MSVGLCGNQVMGLAAQAHEDIIDGHSRLQPRHGIHGDKPVELRFLSNIHLLYIGERRGRKGHRFGAFKGCVHHRRDKHEEGVNKMFVAHGCQFLVAGSSLILMVFFSSAGLASSFFSAHDGHTSKG